MPAASSRGDGADAAYLAAQYGLKPDPWQQLVLDGWLGVRDNGLWASPRCGLVVARQNGKNALLEMRVLYGMLMRGERILHTAHQLKTAQKMFRRLLVFFDNPKRYPKLKARVRLLHKGNGQEAIYLDNDASFELIARSNLSGVGFSCDVMILDEAQYLEEEELGALLPTISASSNPQRIYTGIPADLGVGRGHAFARLRDVALAGGDGRLCWHGWGADGTVDLDDPSVWAVANPAQGIRLNIETIADERRDLDEEQFMRQRLGMWSISPDSKRVISADNWAACADPGLLDGQAEAAFAIDVTNDRRSASICAASFTAAGVPFVDVVETRRGEPDWGVEKIVRMCDRWHVRAVVIDAGGPAASLVEPLRQRGVTVTAPTVRQMAAACGGFYDAVMDGRLRHLDQPILNTALALAKKRDYSDGGWLWHRKTSECDITPLTTATLALWGLTSSEIVEKPRPRTGVAVFV